MDKLYCFYCNKDVIPKVTKKENIYNVHKKNIKIKEDIFECPHCKNEIINNNLDNSLYLIYDEYLKSYDLSFKKLKEIRESYNLSQDLFSKALNISKRSIIRYENASSLPQIQNIMIYKNIMNNKNEFLNILNNNKSTINDTDYYKIYNLVNDGFDLKTINVFLYVLDNNYLTKTQIMKNLFAIDFEFYKEYNSSITNLKYAHGTYGPIIDNKDFYIQYLLKQGFIEFVNDENDNITFKSIQKCDLNLFSKQEILVMNKVIKKLKDKTSNELTNWSHNFKGWINTKPGKIISYSYAKDFDLIKGW